ncbi:MAG: hypothetical protein O2U61_07140 [Candidatus Bathyarchaeota archaeon]|nr:hypothetical protein [Candidatus Bathyarchaeota archaeon]
MKISLLSAWNSDSGAATHAEFIGREWIKMGHNLSVFSFIKSDSHGNLFLRKDEPYVVRCFGTPRTNFFNPKPITEKRADILIVEDLGMLPNNELAKIFPLLKKGAKTINIIHDNKLSTDPSFYLFDWDKVVVFDQRYKKVFKSVYPEEIIKTIPYPCGPWKVGSQNKARRELKLPKDKKIILIFGWWAKTLLPYLSSIKKISNVFPIYLLVVSKDQKMKKKYLSFHGKKMKVDFREKIVSIEVLYKYSHASDVVIFGDKKAKGVVVCSTALSLVGAGCPIIVPDSKFFETFKSGVFKYKNKKELVKKIITVFKKGKRYKKTLGKMKKFVVNNNPRKIAQKYINLFKKLII